MIQTTRCGYTWVVLLAGWWAAGPAVSRAAEIWDGPPLYFAKAGGADPALPENQDRLTDNVWITRGTVMGIYNARLETGYGSLGIPAVSPADTLWAVGTTADLPHLAFDTWFNLVDPFSPTAPFDGPPDSVGADLVVHLVTDDIFLDLRFTEWGMGAAAGGSVAYVRSTAVPEPGTAILAVIAGVGPLLAGAAQSTRRRGA